MKNKDKNKILYTIISILIVIIVIILLLTRCSKKETGNIKPIENPSNTDNNIKNNNNNNNNYNNNNNNNINNNNNNNSIKDDNTKQVDKDIEIKQDINKNTEKTNDNKKTNNAQTNNSSNINIKNNDTSSGNENEIDDDKNNNEYNNEIKENENTSENETKNNEEGELIVDWGQTTQLEIFYNDYFNDIKIAPGVSGEYSFEITNGRGNKIKYNIRLSDMNNYNINMKYRLKKDGEYVVGDNENWKNVSDINYNNQQLNINKSDKYILEWKWEDSDNDTLIGQNIDANYSLQINIYGEDLIE